MKYLVTLTDGATETVLAVCEREDVARFITESLYARLTTLTEELEQDQADYGHDSELVKIHPMLELMHTYTDLSVATLFGDRWYYLGPVEGWLKEEGNL